MPEKKEDVTEPQKDNFDAILGENNRTNSKCKKILQLFRHIRRESNKSQILGSHREKTGGKKKKKKIWNLEDRKELFKKNMENSWSELPNTLQRKREKISDAILSEYHESDSDVSEKNTFGNFGKKSKEKSYDFKNYTDEPKREFFRRKEEDEFDSINDLKSIKSSETQKKVKKKTSDIIFEESVEVSLENVRKLGENDYEDVGEPVGENEISNDRKKETYNTEAAVEEINLLFHDLIRENGNRATDPSTSSDSGNSDTYVNVTFSSSKNFDGKHDGNQERKKINRPNEETKKKVEMNFKRSDSSDSLLNGSSASVSSASELSQRETGYESNKEILSMDQVEIEGNSFEQNAEITYTDEINEAKTRWKNLPRRESSNERKSCCEETVKLLAKFDKVEFEKDGNLFPRKAFVKETTEYSDIMFAMAANSQGFFVNEEFNDDVNFNTLKKRNENLTDTSDRKIVYQELSFRTDCHQKTDDEVVEEKQPNDGQKTVSNVSSLSEEQKAKKKSAEAIAKELSCHVFSKRNQSSNEESQSIGECSALEQVQKENTVSGSPTVSSAEVKALENKTIITISIKTEADGKVEDKPTEKSQIPDGTKPEDPKPTEETNNPPEVSKSDEETWETEDKKDLSFGCDLQYFSVADWRKAVAMGSKRGISSLAMETIVEEPETDTSTKLTVREILRRFEELGNKHFNDKLCMTDDERTATLKQIHQTLKCLEEKVKNFEVLNESCQQHQQYLENPRVADQSSGAWTGRGPTQRQPHSTPTRGHVEPEEVAQTSLNDGKHSLLQFAIHHFRQSPEKFEMLKTSDGSISGSLKVIESKNKKNKEKGKSGGKDSSEWTWKEQVDLVKFTAKPIEQSLLQLNTPELSDLAVECFICLMRYMGDLPMPTDVSEVKCVYTILMHCHNFEQLRDEVYCQLMKQTTNNKSIQQESCQRGWRLFSIVAAYFVCSDTLKPFLFKYLETAAYDKRRAYHGTAMVCLQNLRKTFKYGGRKNVPSVEEITAISAGRNSKRQIYRLPGGTEKVVNTKSTTVVQDVIEELCVMINVTNPQEIEEFSVYCIIEGDTFTMPLAREEYILDVTTELHKNHQVFYLIFCRSVWYFPLRLDSQLYVEVVFNQIAPDYLEGLLLIMPGESLEQEVIYDISKIAALLHRAADMTQVPTMKETKFLLPKPALSVRDVKPSQWVNMVQSNWQEFENLTAIQAKAQVLDVLSKWPLFGSSFFAVKKASEPKERTDHILALNRSGVHFIDLITHETLLHYPFSEVISTRKVKSEDGTLFLDMKCGNLMQQRITRLQTDQAHEISRLIRQYITMQQRMGGNHM